MRVCTSCNPPLIPGSLFVGVPYSTIRRSVLKAEDRRFSDTFLRFVAARAIDASQLQSGAGVVGGLATF